MLLERGRALKSAGALLPIFEPASAVLPGTDGAVGPVSRFVYAEARPLDALCLYLARTAG